MKTLATLVSFSFLTLSCGAVHGLWKWKRNILFNPKMFTFHFLPRGVDLQSTRQLILPVLKRERYRHHVIIFFGRKFRREFSSQ